MGERNGRELATQRGRARERDRERGKERERTLVS